MKLYIYEHCPFCSRVQYVAKSLGIKLETVVLAYDDTQTPNTLIGKKMVPILVKDDEQVMVESDAIIAYLIELAGSDEVREVSQQALDWQSRSFNSLLRIGYPRWYSLDLEEFSSEKARQAWLDRKQTDTVNFTELIEKPEEAVIDSNAFLQETEAQLTFKAGYAQLSLVDQAIYFSLLRGYCCEPSIQWPVQLQTWLNKISKDTSIPLLK
ncbi:glutaredoxin 2 [Psychromonas arctica]|uniref:glutaredoxin 2 n=1 Tax=Psychromonas arctica TaxID=168275 RepID=UPI00041ACD9C|nr:glutaredoxin 2 [Psychromonas arctica]